MNVACHSSFDTNFRVRISTPTGQVDLEPKSPARDMDLHQQDSRAASSPKKAEDLGGTAWPTVSQEPVPHHGEKLYPDPQTLTAGPVYFQGAQDFDAFLFPETWDFGGPSPSDPIFHNLTFVDGLHTTEPFVPSLACLSLPATGIPQLQHVAPAFSCETYPVLDTQVREGTGTEWWTGEQQRW